MIHPDKYKGSNWYHWRRGRDSFFRLTPFAAETRTQPIRTISEISAHINILPAIQIPLYQKLSIKAKQLKSLGMSYDRIASELKTSESTIVRACKYND